MLRLNQFLITLQNAQQTRKLAVYVPFSKHIWECAQTLLQFGVLESVTLLKNSSYENYYNQDYAKQALFQEGFLDGTMEIPHQAFESTPRIYRQQKKRSSQIRCILKYSDKTPTIETIQLLSTPGSKVGWKFSRVIRECSRPGHLIFLTRYGILTETEALRAEVGGLPLCRLFLYNWKQ